MFFLSAAILLLATGVSSHEAYAQKRKSSVVKAMEAEKAKEQAAQIISEAESEAKDIIKELRYNTEGMAGKYGGMMEKQAKTIEAIVYR